MQNHQSALDSWDHSGKKKNQFTLCHPQAYWLVTVLMWVGLPRNGEYPKWLAANSMWNMMIKLWLWKTAFRQTRIGIDHNSHSTTYDCSGVNI
jgi:hypothetical protein